MADSDVLNSKRAVSYAALTKILLGLLKPELAAVAELRARVEQLEQREYKGVWSDDTAYVKGAMVSRQGSLWVSTVNENRAKPGEHPHWKLAVKRGRGGEGER